MRNPLENAHEQILFEDKPDAEIDWAGTAHGEIVHRAVDGQCADVPTWEKQRLDHIRIRREGQFYTAQRSDHTVMARLTQWIDRQLADGSPLLAVLGTEADTPTAWMEAGQALERVLLQACAKGRSHISSTH